jgi:hypothetical protein
MGVYYCLLSNEIGVLEEIPKTGSLGMRNKHYYSRIPIYGNLDNKNNKKNWKYIGRV